MDEPKATGSADLRAVGRQLRALTRACSDQELTCEGCGRDLPVLTAEELAELPEWMPPLCDECLSRERVEMQRLAHGGGR